jgi:hypothetical protein
MDLIERERSRAKNVVSSYVILVKYFQPVWQAKQALVFLTCTAITVQPPTSTSSFSGTPASFELFISYRMPDYARVPSVDRKHNNFIKVLTYHG